MRSFALNLANLPHKFKAAFGAQAKHFKFAVKFGRKSQPRQSSQNQARL